MYFSQNVIIWTWHFDAHRAQSAVQVILSPNHWFAPSLSCFLSALSFLTPSTISSRLAWIKIEIVAFAFNYWEQPRVSFLGKSSMFFDHLKSELWPGAGTTNTKVIRAKRRRAMTFIIPFYFFFKCVHFGRWQKALKLGDGTAVTQSLSSKD